MNKAHLDAIRNCSHKNFNEEGSDYRERDRCLDCGAVREVTAFGPLDWKHPRRIAALLKANP